MERLLDQHGVLVRDCKHFVNRQSDRLKAAAQAMAARSGRPYLPGGQSPPAASASTGGILIVFQGGTGNLFHSRGAVPPTRQNPLFPTPEPEPDASMTDSPASRPKKPHLLRRLYDWTLTWADTPYGTPALAILAFAESSFFPIPPDVLLTALAFSQPKRWWRYALLCSVASVAGGIVGWWIGLSFWHLTADFFFRAVPGFTPEIFALVQQKYNDNAFVAILTAAFTPIPYKVFTIASGVFGVPITTLIWASVLGRSARFFALAGVIRLYGPKVRPFLERNFEWACTALFLLAVVGFLAIKWFA